MIFFVTIDVVVWLFLRVGGLKLDPTASMPYPLQRMPGTPSVRLRVAKPGSHDQEVARELWSPIGSAADLPEEAQRGVWGKGLST